MGRLAGRGFRLEVGGWIWTIADGRDLERQTADGNQRRHGIQTRPSDRSRSSWTAIPQFRTMEVEV